jgi:hypothetical protein
VNRALAIELPPLSEYQPGSRDGGGGSDPERKHPTNEAGPGIANLVRQNLGALLGPTCRGPEGTRNERLAPVAAPPSGNCGVALRLRSDLVLPRHRRSLWEARPPPRNVPSHKLAVILQRCGFQNRVARVVPNRQSETPHRNSDRIER